MPVNERSAPQRWREAIRSRTAGILCSAPPGHLLFIVRRIGHSVLVNSAANQISSSSRWRRGSIEILEMSHIQSTSASQQVESTETHACVLHLSCR